MKLYSLRKAKSIFKNVYKLYRRKKKKLSLEASEKFRLSLIELQEAILNRDREKADLFSRELESLSKKYFTKKPWEKFLEPILSFGVALAVAMVIRQTVFEPFQIPSGSMRPTFREKDCLVVSKSQFGLNIPFTTSHLLFQPEEVKRMGVFIFSGEGMDISNVKTMNFYLFPGYKQFIKRMIGLPGDVLYFYGGRIYGVDKNGNDISQELQLESLSYLEHIPYIHIEGKTISTKTTGKGALNDLYSSTLIKQMNLPIAKLTISPTKELHHTFISKPNPHTASNTPLDLYQYWGIENYATVRILPKALLENKKDLPYALPSSEFYLELSHHPSVTKATIGRDLYLRQRAKVHLEKSYIPLSEAHMKSLWEHMVTGRFTVEEGLLRRHGVTLQEAKHSASAPKLQKNIPDGTYEFLDGKLSTVKIGGISSQVAIDHPLATFENWKCFLFFNAGIECDTHFLPQGHDNGILPARYAYFRDGALYVMGAPIFSKEDPNLKAFVQNETARKSPSYSPFIDKGAPLKVDGSLDIEKVLQYGLQVPEHSYLALGDNHAMSADSRDFGFVPQGNLRGVPAFMFWAPNDRFGFPNHGIYPQFTLPRLIIYANLLLILILWIRYDRRQKNLRPTLHRNRSEA
jgi:signal peptidase I